MDEQPTLPPELRASLPPVVRAYIAVLEGQVSLLRDQVKTLRAGTAKLQAQLADAQAGVQQHSGNSSRPPSSDPPSAPHRPKRPRTGRKRGGQKGHPRRLRLQVAEADLTAIVDHRPARYPNCASPLAADLAAEGGPRRLQVWEIPPIQPDVTEHRAAAVRCLHCQELVKAADLPFRVFGPRLTTIGPIGDWGKEGIALVAQVFAAWHRFKQGELDRTGRQAAIGPLREQMQTLLAQGGDAPLLVGPGLLQRRGQVGAGLVDLRDGRGGRADQQRRRTGLAAGCLVAQGVLRGGQCRRQRVRRAHLDRRGDVPSAAG